ncbi:hypothetical protein [Cryobacterium sp. Hh38]|uniref:hypothetical protein n=1 Tax=Cryobacterium sp. Hh38 TaxID=1259156 RepID=UPI001069EF8D|nr:hypothetical protein [Cryobacterium sp. Hh38]TFD60311.1 hypothetical protein E3T41_08465 [Cryobacterium sp. Hh38]
MKAPANRNLSQDELKDRLVRASHRLSRHLSNFIAGNIGAGDDLAAILRTVVCTGKGDDVIGRVVKAFHLTSPKLVISPPANGELSTMFSVGSLPIPEGFGELPEGTPEVATFHEWRDRVCLVIERDDSGTRVFTWGRFIATAANTWGSHTAATIPLELDETRMHLFGNRPIDEYLLVQAAMVVEWVLESLLMELNLHGPAVRATDTTPVMLAWLRIHDLGRQAEVRAIPGLRHGTLPGEYPILEVPLRRETVVAVSFLVDDEGRKSVKQQYLPPRIGRP